MVAVPVPDGDIPVLLGELTIHFGVDEAVLEGPPDAGQVREVEGSPRALHTLARFDERGRYRALPGARSLAGGWFARFEDIEALAAAVDAVYPLAQVHSTEWAEGRLRVVPMEDVLGRQAGRYEVAGELSPEGQNVAVAVLCGQCVRVPVWRGAVPREGDIPCPEACSVMVSLCREAALWEREQPERQRPDPEAPFAAFDIPGNETRERYLVARYGGAHG